MFDITYREQLRKALADSKASGIRVRKVFNKSKFLQEFPKAANDPRMDLVGDKFILDVTPLESLTVGELRQMCLDACDHPLAVTKGLSVEGLADHTVVSILREELDILRVAGKGPVKPEEIKLDETKPISSKPPKKKSTE